MRSVLKKVELSFSSLEFYDCFVVSTIHEGIVFDKNLCEIMVATCVDYFTNTPFIYIANRINNYNVVPTIYLKLENVPNFKGIAIVDRLNSDNNLPLFEKKFTNFPFEAFREMEEAVAWAEAILKK